MTEEDRRGELSHGLLGCAYDSLTPVQKSVIDLIASESPSGLHPSLHMDDRGIWMKLADGVAAVGGSWRFIGGFTAGLAVWIGVNLLLSPEAFDPYPFVFLNLILSTIAALQAPVIMMSQNRQAARDRAVAEHDYRVNLRAELEILRLHDRLQLNEAQLGRIEAAIVALGPGGPGDAAGAGS